MNEAQKPCIAIRCVLFKDALTPSSVTEGGSLVTESVITWLRPPGRSDRDVPGSHLNSSTYAHRRPALRADHETDSHRVGGEGFRRGVLTS